MPRAKTVAWHAPIVLTFSAGPNAALLTLPDVTMYIADTDCELVVASEVHEVLGSDGSAVTADIVKASDGSTLAAGTSLLTSTFNLKSVINTVQYKRLGSGITPPANYVRAGQRIGINFTGTMTALAGVCITLVVHRLGRPSW